MSEFGKKKEKKKVVLTVKLHKRCGGETGNSQMNGICIKKVSMKHKPLTLSIRC